MCAAPLLKVGGKKRTGKGTATSTLVTAQTMAGGEAGEAPTISINLLAVLNLPPLMQTW